MSAPVPAPSPAGPGTASQPAASSKARSAAVLVCLVIATLLTVPAGVAYWGQRTLNDTGRYIDTVGPLSESPEVQDVIVTTVTDALESQVDVRALLEDALAEVVDDAPRLERLVAPLAAAISTLVEREVRDLVASEEFSEAWTRINTRAQQTLQRVLTGDESGAVSLDDGQLVLNLDELIERARDRLVVRGLTLLENAPLPTTDRQVVLLDAPALEQARTIYAFSNPVAKWLLPITVLLYVAAFALSRNRPRVAVTIGLLLAANAVVLALVLATGRQLFVNELSGTVFGPASRVFFDTLLGYLHRGREVVLWLGLVLAVAGLYAGSGRAASALRTSVSGGLHHAGEPLGDAGAAVVGRWTAANAAWLRVGAVVLGAVVLLWGNDVTLGRLLGALALVLVLLVALEVLIGAARRQPPVPSAP